MKRKGFVGVFWAVVLVFIVGVFCYFKVSMQIQDALAKKYEDRGVPIMEIVLNGVKIDEIDEGSKETKYGGNEINIYNDGAVDKYDEVEIKGRGNGTWMQKKKPYQIKFEQKVNLFGLGKAKKWYLLANAIDGTDLRTEVAYYLEDMLGMEYKFEGKYVELYIDGDYRGLYYLTRAMEIDKGVVDLREPLGVLVELDNLYWGTEKNYVTSNGDHLIVKDAVEEEKIDIAMSEFLRDYNELEAAVEARDFARVSEVIDVESFVRYYLLSEFTVNPDAYWTSFYMNKDGSFDKIHAGPGWDFDLSLGNLRWVNWQGELIYSTTETMVRKNEIMTDEEYREKGLDNYISSGEAISRIMFDLMEMPEFRREVSRFFQERMSGRKNELLGVVSRGYEKIEEALIEDGKKWGDKIITDGVEIGGGLDSEETGKTKSLITSIERSIKVKRGEEKKVEEIDEEKVAEDINNEVKELIRWIGERYDFFEKYYGEGGENESDYHGGVEKYSEGVIKDSNEVVKRRLL